MKCPLPMISHDQKPLLAFPGIDLSIFPIFPLAKRIFCLDIATQSQYRSQAASKALFRDSLGRPAHDDKKEVMPGAYCAKDDFRILAIDRFASLRSRTIRSNLLEMPTMASTSPIERSGEQTGVSPNDERRTRRAVRTGRRKVNRARELSQCLLYRSTLGFWPPSRINAFDALRLSDLHYKRGRK